MVVRVPTFARVQITAELRGRVEHGAALRGQPAVPAVQRLGEGFGVAGLADPPDHRRDMVDRVAAASQQMGEFGVPHVTGVVAPVPG
ncbi:hypothetical protein GCM10023223_03750 [Stackebrandtia albiflava]